MTELIDQRLAALREGRRSRLEAARVVKLAREGQGWTQRQLAEHLGIHMNSVARMERGEMTVTERTRRQLDALRGRNGR